MSPTAATATGTKSSKTGKAKAPTARAKKAATPKRYTPAQRAHHLAQMRASGKTPPEYAKKLGISQQTVYSWQRMERAATGSAPTPIRSESAAQSHESTHALVAGDDSEGSVEGTGHSYAHLLDDNTRLRKLVRKLSALIAESV